MTGLTRMVTWEVNHTQGTPPLNKERLRTLSLLEWDWLIHSFNSEDKFCMETIHKGEISRDEELRAIQQLGRTAQVVDLRPYRGNSTLKLAD